MENQKQFVSLLIQRLKDQYLQKWHERVSFSAKLVSYIDLRPHIIMNYIYIILQTYRRVISQFRISAHDLEIERGRYSGIDRNDRICKLCGRTVENEFHFVLICIIYKDLRQKYIPIEFRRSPSIYKLNKLMNVSDESKIFNLALYPCITPQKDEKNIYNLQLRVITLSKHCTYAPVHKCLIVCLYIFSVMGRWPKAINNLSLSLSTMVAGLCHFVFSPRNNATRKKKKRKDSTRKDEITPCEKTKIRNNATRQDEITKPAKRKVEIPTRKDETTPGEKTPFKTVNLSSFSAFRLFAWRYFVFRLFAWRSFVFSRGVMSSFCVASFRVSLFRLFAWRLFDFSHGVFSCGVISSFRVALFRLFAWRYFVFSRGAFSFFLAWRYFGAKRRNGTNQPPYSHMRRLW